MVMTKDKDVRKKATKLEPEKRKPSNASVRKFGHPFQIWFTPDEWAKVQRMAKEDGATAVAEWIREQIGLEARK